MANFNCPTLFTPLPMMLWVLAAIHVVVAVAATNQSDVFKVSQRWGPYRPNLYLGVRPQIPNTLLMGLMWGDGSSQEAMLESLRDSCEQSDGVGPYGWTQYDPRIAGIQEIHDAQLNVDLTTEFVKSSDGESWGLRIKGIPSSKSNRNSRISLVFHLALEGMPATQPAGKTSKVLKCSRATPKYESSRRSLAACDGFDPALGEFGVHLLTDKNRTSIPTPSVLSAWVSNDTIWQAKSHFRRLVSADAADMTEGLGNIHFIYTTVEAPFTMDFFYTSAAASDPLTSKSITESVDHLRASFAHRIEAAFPRIAPLQTPGYALFSRSLFSNLMGGLGFFYGDSKVDLSHTPEDDRIGRDATSLSTMDPTSILSFTPSRPQFPRGFLWDEGFHLLPVIRWDFELAVTVLQSWLSLMDSDGWIAREQILGPEARARVPVEFHTQYPNFGNPPTLILLVPILISLINDPSKYAGYPTHYLTIPREGKRLIRELYPLLAKHHAWFRRTQAGNFSHAYPRPQGVLGTEGYRWRGRTRDHTLTSGLDDYPRANTPHLGELHVDALAWATASSLALQKVSEFLGETADSAQYASQVSDMLHNLDVIHWDPKSEAYCDTTISTQGEFQRVCHLGYVSLLPFLLGLLSADHPRLPKVIDLLSDPSKLWSPYGLRSLSRQDEYYAKGENYWRGAVWMNLNVLTVQRLDELSRQPGPEQVRAGVLAARLGRNTISTVYENWALTGFAWEQYSDTTGQGRHSLGFTGWTACVLLIMGLPSLAAYFGQGTSRIWHYDGAVGSSGKPLFFMLFILTAMLLAITALINRRKLRTLWRRVLRIYRAGYTKVK